MNFPFISVVIPVYNEEKNIGKCLDSLLNQDYPKDKYEIIVVDGNSEDNTKKIVEKYSDIKVLDNPERNTAVGRNIGIKNSKGGYIAFTDGDVIVPKNWLKTLIKNLVTLGERTTGVGGGNIHPKTSNDFVKALERMLHTWWGGMGSVTGSCFNEIKEVESLGGFNSLYKKDIFEKIGYFDENFATGEDAELNVRIKMKGYKLFHIPKTDVIHNPKDTLRKWIKRMFQYGRARMKIMRKHPSSFKPVYLISLIYVVSLIFFPVAYFISNILFKFFLLVIFIFLSSSIIFSLSTYSKHRKVKYIGLILITYISSVISYGIGFLYGVLK